MEHNRIVQYCKSMDDDCYEDRSTLLNVKCDMIKGKESLVEKCAILSFLRPSLITSKYLIFMQPPLKMDVWLQSYVYDVNVRQCIFKVFVN